MRSPRRAARVPEVASSRPPRILRRVVLPEPFGPTRPAWSPSKTPSDRPSKSGAAPNAFDSPWQETRISGTGSAVRDQGFLVAALQALDPDLLAQGPAPGAHAARPDEHDRPPGPCVTRGRPRLVLQDARAEVLRGPRVEGPVAAAEDVDEGQ